MTQLNSKGIDYSKWDNFEDQSSDDENSKPFPTPRVTKLDQPGSVTLSSDGSLTLNSNNSSVRSKNKEIGSKAQTFSRSKIEFVSDHYQQQQKQKLHEVPLTKNRSFNDIYKELVQNGQFFFDSKTNHSIYWSQTKSEVIISVPFDSLQFPSKSIQVAVSSTCSDKLKQTNQNNGKRTSSKSHNPILPYSDRCNAVGTDAGQTNKGYLSVKAFQAGNEHIFLEGKLPHYIHGTEEMDIDEKSYEPSSMSLSRHVEWEIVNDCIYTSHGDCLMDPESKKNTNTKAERKNESSSIRLIQITLRKAVPMYGMFLWWEQPLKHCPSIDVSNISDRRNNIGISENKKKISVWEEAHSMFREKIKSKENKLSQIVL